MKKERQNKTTDQKAPENALKIPILRKTVGLVGGVAVFCVLAVAVQASRMSASGFGFSWNWENLFSVLWLPAAAMTLYSLIVSKRNGWGWVILGSAAILVLLVAQFVWMILTSFSGDPADDEDYFKPLDNWTSDSF